MFSFGVMLMMNGTLVVIIILITPKDQAMGFMASFWEYFEKVPIDNIIYKFIINYALQIISSVLSIFIYFIYNLNILL